MKVIYFVLPLPPMKTSWLRHGHQYKKKKPTLFDINEIRNDRPSEKLPIK